MNRFTIYKTQEQAGEGLSKLLAPNIPILTQFENSTDPFACQGLELLCAVGLEHCDGFYKADIHMSEVLCYRSYNTYPSLKEVADQTQNFISQAGPSFSGAIIRPYLFTVEEEYPVIDNIEDLERAYQELLTSEKLVPLTEYEQMLYMAYGIEPETKEQRREVLSSFIQAGNATVRGLTTDEQVEFITHFFTKPNTFLN